MMLSLMEKIQRVIQDLLNELLPEQYETIDSIGNIFQVTKDFLDDAIMNTDKKLAFINFSFA